MSSDCMSTVHDYIIPCFLYIFLTVLIQMTSTILVIVINTNTKAVADIAIVSVIAIE